MEITSICLNILTIFLFLISYPRNTDGSLTSDQRWSIERFIHQTMKCRGIPGLGISVVKDNETLISEGFGKRIVGKTDKVNESTLFCIASLTKGFTSTLLASILTKNSSISWDTPISELVPEVKFSDDYRTKHTTLRDLLAHRTGVPAYFGALLTGFYRSREELVSRIQFMKPRSRLNTVYTYNNYMYMLAGYVAERLTGKSWNELINQTFLQPLGMTSTVFTDSPDFGNLHSKLAMPHMSFGGKLKALSPSVVNTVYPAGPAGSLCSTPADMVKWMNFHLSKAALPNGTTIVSPQIFNELYKAQINTPTPLPRKILRKPMFPISEGRTGYGLGFGSGTYRGYQVAMHNGLLSGYMSKISLFPEENFGIYTTINGPMTPPAYDSIRVIHHYIADVVLGMEPWLNMSTACSFPQPWYRPKSETRRTSFVSSLDDEDVETNDVKQAAVRDVEPNWPEHPLWIFVGQYGHLAFGNVTIIYNETDNHLHLFHGKVGHGVLHKTSRLLVFTLKYIDELFFLSTADGESDNIYQVRFFLDENTKDANRIVTTLIDTYNPVEFKRGLKWHDLPEETDGPKKTKDCINCASKTSLVLYTLFIVWSLQHV